MDIQEKVAEREDMMARVSDLLKEDRLRVETILDEVALRRAPTIEKLKDYLSILEVASGKNQHIFYFWRVNEFNVCWDALSLKEVQSAESISEIQTAFSRARKGDDGVKSDEVRKLAVFKMAALLEAREKNKAQKPVSSEF